MRRKIILRLSLLIAFLTLLWSCHNEDFAKGETAPQRNNSEFFTHAKKGGANAKSGVDYIDILEAYNRDKDFLSQMPDQKGMPIWDKMYTVDTESATGLMIPLSYDDETMSSILFVTLDSKNEVTGVKDYDNTLLQNIVYDQKISKENRENLFLTFMQMDNRTFGNEHFIGIPKDLFVGKKSDDEYGIMWVRNFAPSSTVTTDETGKLMIIESCFIALHCTHHGGGNICDAEDGCTQCGTTFCTYEVIGTADDPFPSSPSGGGGGCSDCGGGGTTPGPNVPTNPCGTNLGTVFYRLAPGCGGNTDLPDLEDPCEKIKSKFTDTKFKEKVATIDKPEVFADDSEMGYASGYPDVNTGATETQYVLMENNPNTHKVKLPEGNQYFGYMHSHTNDTATEITIKIFSPADVSTFLTSCVSNADEHLSIGDAYSMVITSEGNYMLQYSGTGDYSIGQNQIDNWNKWYKDEYRKLIRDDKLTKSNVEKTFARFLSESVNIPGLEVYYVEKATGKAFKINPDGTKTPCP
jgi:hypothetical protein